MIVEAFEFEGVEKADLATGSRGVVVALGLAAAARVVADALSPGEDALVRCRDDGGLTITVADRDDQSVRIIQTVPDFDGKRLKAVCVAQVDVEGRAELRHVAGSIAVVEEAGVVLLADEAPGDEDEGEVDGDDAE